MEFTVELDPNVSTFLRDFEKSVVDISADLMKEFSDKAPETFSALIVERGRVSKAGETPSSRSGNLKSSPEAEVINRSSVQITLAHQAFYLDPFFEGLGKGGGWLNRPFIDRGIDQTMEKIS